MLNFCWHKWKYVYQECVSTFLGEKCPFLIKSFRICMKCNKAQKFYNVDRVDSWWRTLSDCETTVLQSKVVDKGDYFLLEQSEISPFLKGTPPKEE